MTQLLLFLVGLTFHLSPSFAPADHRIVPAVRIGQVRLGDSQKLVRGRLGKPVRTFKTHGGRTADLWHYDSAADELEVVYKARKVVQIKTSVERFKTAQGISTATALSTIKHMHPRVKERTYLFDTENGGGLNYLDDVKGGIAFVIPIPRKEPEKPEKPWLIIVHPSGRRAIPTEIKDLGNTGSRTKRSRPLIIQ